MQRRLYILLPILFSFLFSNSQTPAYPKDYFRWPVNLKPAIVANLGELRPNHWHMGLDVRTNAKENEMVYAAAGGYIAFIGIRPQSFGRFIIINHPNGLSTLYGHLNDFAPEIEDWVTQQQYEQESWAVELTLPKDKFPVTKGTFIAYSGNTGGSQGPHVHFEIRNTSTGECLNPLMFGFPLPDNVPPSLVKIAMYDRNHTTYAGTPKFFSVKKTDSGYVIPKMPVLNVSTNKLSFGIQAFDRMNGSENQDGIYSAELFVDDVSQIRFAIDSVSYDETSYMNAHIDYMLKDKGGPYIQHVSKLPGDRSGIYFPADADGVIYLNDTNIHRIRIVISDARLNSSSVNFNVRLSGSDIVPQGITSQLQFLPTQVNRITRPEFELYMPETCVYDTVNAFYYRSAAGAVNAISANYQVNDPSIPVQDNLTVRLKPERSVPEEWKEKLVIQRSARNSQSVKKASFIKIGASEWLTAEFGDFGNFRAYVDLIAPSINELGKGDTIDLSAAKRILFAPTDNFGVKTFRAELDGQWLRFTNDKSRNWIYTFDERCPYGVHELKVRIFDLVGNMTTETWWFKRYPYVAPVKKARTTKNVKGKTGSRKKTTSKAKTTTRKKK